jgi:IclR family KDG regulon transcriptional repressor
MSTKYQAPIVKKAFQMLAAISEADRGVGISELSKELGISKGTVHGITVALEEVGAIKRDPLTKKLSLGYAVIELGKRGLSRIPLIDVARNRMDELVRETDETVFLGALRDDHVVILDMVESSKELKITSPAGTKLSLSAGATGKLFLAHMDRRSALKYLSSRKLVQYTKNSITELESYIKEIDEVRLKGFAIDREEYLQGVTAVAALVRTEVHPLVAIWTVGFSSSMAENRMQFVVERTLTAADAISKDLKRI